MKNSMRICIALLITSTPALAQSDGESPPEVDPSPATFEQAQLELQGRLEQSVAELEALQSRITEEKVPLNEALLELQRELGEVRKEYAEATRLQNRSALDVSLLQSELDSLNQNSTYLSDLLSDYSRKFEAGLHISEVHRFEEPISAARLAAEDSDLTSGDVYRIQTELVATSLARLEDSLGGKTFEGRAVADGALEEGTFALVGPAALFLADDRLTAGTAEMRLGSMEPTLVRFPNPEHDQAAQALVLEGEGIFPLDPSLGNAHQLQAAKLGVRGEFEKGGPVMYAIFGLAGAALLVAILKWISMAFLRMPSKRKVQSLLEAVVQSDEEAATQRVKRIGGPVGRMLKGGVQHIRESRELVEEVMYETVLTTRLRLERFLPFVAISAASAPLLGLLGTVTGIIKTFQLLTVHGSGDVKALSGGISEALITTKYGLIVAIPSLLIHAFLSRKARRVTGRMETEAVAFANAVSQSPMGRTIQPHAPLPPAGDATAPAPLDREQVRTQVTEILQDLLGPLVQDPPVEAPTRVTQPN